MKHLRQFVVAAIIGVTATSLASTLPASAATNSPALSARAVPAIAPPQTAAGRDGRLRAAADTVTCYNQAMLRARATTIGPWEQYSLCYDSTAAYWYIESDANGMYVSAEFGYTGNDYAMLRASAQSVTPPIPS